MFRLYAKDEINQAGGECVFVRSKHSLRDKCERKKHERSLSTVVSDAGSTPAASTNLFRQSLNGICAVCGGDAPPGKLLGDSGADGAGSVDIRCGSGGVAL